ncbi:MAG: heme o synthase [Bacteroidota bacterium]
MSKVVATTKTASSNQPLLVVLQKLKDYQQLVKFRLSGLVVFSAVMAYMIASQGAVPLLGIIVLSLGGFLVTGASNALNQVLERDYDRIMQRTSDRPLAAGRMTISEAVMSAGFMSLFGITLLALFNPWAALLGTISMIVYAYVYTPLKRVSSIAVLVGAIPGALPTMIGVVAIEGHISPLALVLFGIQFLWQFPHFWAIGWLGHGEYQKAGFRFIPTVNGQPDPQIGWQAFIYALFLIPVSIMPGIMGVSGLYSSIFVLVLGIVYAYFGWNLYRQGTRKAATQLMFSSFLYLPLVLVALYLDKI